MTGLAQSLAIRDIEQNFFREFSIQDALVERDERNDVMRVKDNGLAIARFCSAILANVIISCKNSVAPNGIFRGLAQRFLNLRSAAAPVPVESSALQSVANSDSLPVLLCSRIMTTAGKTWNSRPVMMWLDKNRLTAAALTEMFALVFRHPRVGNALVGISEMLARIGAFAFPALRKTAQSISLIHSEMIYAMERRMSSKSGELQETLPGDAGGNLQPSREYTLGRFIDYRSGTARLITGFSARHESDEIVSAHSNVG